MESRPWVRTLGFAALGAVILQGLLGGLTVIFFLPPAISIGHAGLAQIFFCLALTLALVTSPGWKNAAAPVDDRLLRRLAVTTTVLVYTQILVGATMRHTNAGLAIPDFPYAFGHVLPPVWNAKVAIHFAHRLALSSRSPSSLRQATSSTIIAAAPSWSGRRSCSCCSCRCRSRWGRS